MMVRWGFIALVGVVFLGALVRVSGIGVDSLWLDEGYSVKAASMEVGEMFRLAARDDNHPPLYYLLLHFWMGVLSSSEAAVRMMSVVFGVGAILGVYALGRELLGKECGLVGAVFIGASAFHIRFSQEARSYALLTFLAVGSMYYYVRMVRPRTASGGGERVGERAGFGAVIGYVVFSVLLMHCHVYGLFLILAQNLYVVGGYVWDRWQGRSDSLLVGVTVKKWFVLQGVLLVLFGPWLCVMLRQMSRVLEGYWMVRPTLGTLLNTLLLYGGTHDWWSKLAAVVMALLGVVALLRVEKGRVRLREEGRGVRALLLVWLGVAVLLPFVVSQFVSPIYQAKSTIAASVALMLLAANGVLCLKRRSARYGAVGLFVVLSVLSVREYRSEPRNEQWREVAAYIESEGREGDVAMFVAGYCLGDVYSYYSDSGNVLATAFPTTGTRDVDEENAKSVDGVVKGYERVWLVLSHADGHDPKGLVKERLTGLYGEGVCVKYVGVEVWRFGS